MFLSVLFDKGEHTCFTNSAKGTSVYAAAPDATVFFTINPLHPTQDLNPKESWHSPNRPRRSDANVVAFRNILVEIDDLPVDQQRTYIESLGLPYSTATYSGNKSIHYIISLETPLSNAEQYRALVGRVYKACQLGTKKVADPSCKNPSRLSRFPGAVRPDTGRLQELLYVGSRIENECLERWLIAKGAPNVPPPEPQPILKALESGGNWNLLPGYVKSLLMFGAASLNGEARQRLIYKSAIVMAACGYTFEEIYLKLVAAPSVLSARRTEEVLEKMIEDVFRKLDRVA